MFKQILNYYLKFLVKTNVMVTDYVSVIYVIVKMDFKELIAHAISSASTEVNV